MTERIRLKRVTLNSGETSASRAVRLTYNKKKFTDDSSLSIRPYGYVFISKKTTFSSFHSPKIESNVHYWPHQPVYSMRTGFFLSCDVDGAARQRSVFPIVSRVSCTFPTASFRLGCDHKQYDNDLTANKQKQHLCGSI